MHWSRTLLLAEALRAALRTHADDAREAASARPDEKESAMSDQGPTTPITGTNSGAADATSQPAPQSVPAAQGAAQPMPEEAPPAPRPQPAPQAEGQLDLHQLALQVQDLQHQMRQVERPEHHVVRFEDPLTPEERQAIDRAIRNVQARPDRPNAINQALDTLIVLTGGGALGTLAYKSVSGDDDNEAVTWSTLAMSAVAFLCLIAKYYFAHCTRQAPAAVAPAPEAGGGGGSGGGAPAGNAPF